VGQILSEFFAETNNLTDFKERLLILKAYDQVRQQYPDYCVIDTSQSFEITKENKDTQTEPEQNDLKLTNLTKLKLKTVQS